MTSHEGAAGRRSVRLIFEHEPGGGVRLVSQQVVDVAVTGFDLTRTSRPGHYVEVRDAADRTLARTPLRDAFTASAEILPEAPGGPITRVDVPPQGAFTVVVPVSPEGRRVAVVRLEPAAGVAPPTAEVAGAVETIELASFELDA